MGKKKAVDKASVRCPIAGCKFQLRGDNRKQCDRCQGVFCAQHAYPADHDCQQGAKKASASTSGSGGLVVVGGTSKKNEEEDKKKDQAKEEEILNKLLKIDTSELLKELIAFGASSARYESSTIVQAMSMDAKSIQKALFGTLGTSIVEAAQAQGQVENITQHLEKRLNEVVKADKMSSVEERRAMSVATFYGMFLAVNADVDFHKAMETSIQVAASNSEKIAKTIASDVIKPLALREWGNGKNYDSASKAFLMNLCDQVLGASEENDTLRNGLSHAAAAIAGSCGGIFCVEDLVGKLEPATKKTKDTGRIMGCMKLVQTLSKEIGDILAPYLIRNDFFSHCINTVYEKVASGGRSSVKKALVQASEKLGPRGVRLVVPVLLGTIEESGAWRSKALGLQVFGAMAKRKEQQMFRDLPMIVPAVMECVKDTKKQVSEAASEALDCIGGMITNSETLQLMPWLLEALKNPEKVEPCLDELMDTTFVNSIDAQSLALIIPVVLRGLREGNAEVKLKATITTGNVCSLVADVHDMRPFISSLMPELKKLQDHSNPRVRDHALQAKQSLQEDMAMTRRRSSHDKQNNCMVDLNATQALNEAIEGTELMQKIPSKFIHEFAMETARMFLFDMYEDMDENFPRGMALKLAREQVSTGIVPLVKEATLGDASALDAFVEEAAHAVVASLFKAQGRNVSEEDSGDNEKDYIVYLPSIILAFASKLLLKRTGLYFERGHRYAVVGMNGVGKTTLLNRIAARDINGFPEDVTLYYVQHEIMAEDKDLSVISYMERDLEESVTKKKKKKSTQEERRAKIVESLNLVGFSEQLQNSAVASLSGGWRMRLAIARSMLYEPELLLLDEPTNHLDVDAVKWLQEYLASLEGTTIGLVSHDYDFVNYVATDIIHLADLKLAYYGCTFKEFQKQRPDIVAALPKKDDSGGGGNTVLDLLTKAKDDDEAAALISNIKPMNFPEGCKLNGVSNRGKAIISLTDVRFSYPGTDKVVFSGVNAKLSLNSRVALLGPNGAGKSTLVKLIVGELELSEGEGHTGKLWKHQSVRVSYIAQHSMHHLESSIEQTPCQYIQARFWEGQDKEAAKMITVKLTDEDKEVMTQGGEISEIVSRVIRGKKLFYEVVKNGRTEKGDNKDFRSLDQLEELGKTRPHVMKLVRLFDEKLKMAESGADLRPLTTPEMIKHLEQFGIDADLAQRKIRWMSGGQKSRLVLAAAMWTRPHIIVLDEPTNYLDNESMAALTHALKNFRGGVLLISHHEGFVSAIAKEHWHLGDGTVRVELLKKANEE